MAEARIAIRTAQETILLAFFKKIEYTPYQQAAKICRLLPNGGAVLNPQITSHNVDFAKLELRF